MSQPHLKKKWQILKNFSKKSKSKKGTEKILLPGTLPPGPPQVFEL